jgi:glutathione S-transferase
LTPWPRLLQSSRGFVLRIRLCAPGGGNDVKLYNEHYPAPNPRKVRIYLAEKGLGVELVHVPMRDRAHKAPDFMKKNSLGQVPVLELDDGRFISESLAICRYFEALHPAKPLFGETPFEQAMVEMWIRRVEFRLWAPMSQVWRNADERTEPVIKTRFKEFGEYSRTVVADAMSWLDGELADGREFLAGARYSMADIVLLCGIDFAKFVRMEMPGSATHLRAWHARASARPSARA